MKGNWNKTAKGGFSRDVRYIYLKQLEEAEIIVLNKRDLLKPVEMERLMKKITRDWPGKRLLQISARTGEGMDEWFSMLISGRPSSTNRLMEVDYERYGTGEALLGWFNARLQLKQGPWQLDGNMLLEGLALSIQKRLEEDGIEIAHFKMSLRSAGGSPSSARELAVVNVVRNGSLAEISRRMAERVEQAEILINLRAEGSPEILEKIVRAEIKDLPLTWEETAAFRPGKPVPVHRITAVTV